MKKLAFIFSFAICGLFVKGQTIDWAVQGDGINDNGCFDLQLDATNNAVYATGYYLDDDVTFGSTTLTNNGNYDFYLTKYDTSGNFVWARGVGDANDQRGRGVGVDATGNVYVAGFFSGNMNFPAPASTNLASNGHRDVFVAKYNSDGDALWATSIGATGAGAGGANDRAIDIAVDASGNSYVTGFFEDTIFFATDTFPAAAGARGAFVMKVDPSGNITNFYQIEGSGDVEGRYLDVDGNSDIYVTGYYLNNIDIDGDGTPDETTLDGEEDGFVIKLDNNLNYQWGSVFGGLEIDEPRGIAVDFNGNVYVSGRYENFVSFGGCGPCGLSASTQFDAFYVKYDNTGTAVYANNIQGPGAEETNGIAVDPVTGDVYLTGRLSDNTLFTGGTVQTTNGNEDIFIVKYSSTEALEWVFTVGGPTIYDIGYGIGVNNDRIYFAGQFRDTANFQGISLETYDNFNEVFISKLVVDPVPNDECVNAEGLTVNTTYTPTSADLKGATSSVTACTGSSNDDEWFSFVATGDSVQIQVESTGATPFDPVVQVYNGCGGTSLVCNNDDADTMEVFSVTGLTPGNTYYLRVHSFNNNIFYNSANSIDTDYEIGITGNITTGLEPNGILSGITVAPNPAGASTSLIVQSSKSVSGVLKLMNSNGQLVSTQSVDVVSGTNQYDFDLNGLASGVYIINLVTEYEVINVPFVK